MPFKSAERFTNKSEHYSKFRPSYPKEVISYLKKKKTLNLKSSDIIADVGSGTGIFTELLLNNGNLVYGVEPNKEMRKKAEDNLEAYPNFKSIAGTAENTTLKDRSINLITVAQAFHWFDIEDVRKEFQRIIEENGGILLIWNHRRTDSLFSKDYETLLTKYCPNYGIVHHREADRDIEEFFHSESFKIHQMTNYQEFDLRGLLGRLFSSSYTPKEGEDNYQLLISEMEKLFKKHQIENKIRFEYFTMLYYGKLNKKGT